MTPAPPTGPHERDDRWLSFGKDTPAAAGGERDDPAPRRATDPRDPTGHRD